MLKERDEQSWGGTACLMRFCERTSASISPCVMDKIEIVRSAVKMSEWWQIWHSYLIQRVHWYESGIGLFAVREKVQQNCTFWGTKSGHLSNLIREPFLQVSFVTPLFVHSKVQLCTSRDQNVCSCHIRHHWKNKCPTFFPFILMSHRFTKASFRYSPSARYLWERCSY